MKHAMFFCALLALTSACGMAPAQTGATASKTQDWENGLFACRVVGALDAHNVETVTVSLVQVPGNVVTFSASASEVWENGVSPCAVAVSGSAVTITTVQKTTLAITFSTDDDQMRN